MNTHKTLYVKFDLPEPIGRPILIAKRLHRLLLFTMTRAVILNISESIDCVVFTIIYDSLSLEALFLWAVRCASRKCQTRQQHLFVEIPCRLASPTAEIFHVQVLYQLDYRTNCKLATLLCLRRSAVEV